MSSSSSTKYDAVGKTIQSLAVECAAAWRGRQFAVRMERRTAPRQVRTGLICESKWRSSKGKDGSTIRSQKADSRDSSVTEMSTEGTALQDIWTDINPITIQSAELLGYPTQKPEALLERILKASSNEGDLVADFFVAPAPRRPLRRSWAKWIATDLGKFAIHTTRKRLIGVQRELRRPASLSEPSRC